MYSKGVVSKVMEKMGNKGKGLGKVENDIAEPNIVEKKDRFKSTSEKNSKSKGKS